MAPLLGTMAAMVATALIGFTVVWARARFARRRHAAIGRGRAVTVPVRLRGAASRYPGVFRLGRLDLATARWRPGGRWGIPVSLAGATVASAREATRDDPGLFGVGFEDDVVLTCRDRRASMFELCVYPDDVWTVQRCLAARGPIQPDPRDSRWWQRLQNLAPPSTLVCLLAGAVWLVWIVRGPHQDLGDTGRLVVGLGGAGFFGAFGVMFAVRQAWHRRRLGGRPRRTRRAVPPGQATRAVPAGNSGSRFDPLAANLVWFRVAMGTVRRAMRGSR